MRAEIKYLVATGNQTPTCLTHKRSAAEAQQPASKQKLQLCIYTAKG